MYIYDAAMGYLEGIKFRGYLISRLENNYILRVFDFVISSAQNILRVFNFAILVKIRNESLIEYQFFLFLINVIVIKYATEALTSFL